MNPTAMIQGENEGDDRNPKAMDSDEIGVKDRSLKMNSRSGT